MKRESEKGRGSGSGRFQDGGRRVPEPEQGGGDWTGGGAGWGQSSGAGRVLDSNVGGRGRWAGPRPRAGPKGGGVGIE